MSTNARALTIPPRTLRGPKVKIATWNVNGIRARETRLREFIEEERPDILCLQEIKATVDQLPMWLCDIEGYSCYWHRAKGYSGVPCTAEHLSRHAREK